jgi:UDP-N-acetylmuramate dehydrogenase
MTPHAHGAASSLWQTIHADLVHAGVHAVLDAPLGARTTYRVGGTGAVVAEVRSFEDLVLVSRIVRSHSLSDVLVVGNGSNMLVSDSGFDGLAIVLQSVGPNEVRLEDGGALVVSGHASLPQLARQSVSMKRCGLEWAVGVPGTAGGAVRMNAGGHGSDMAASITEVSVVDVLAGRFARVPVGDLGLRFRASALQGHHVVVSVRCATTECGVDEGRHAHHGRTCTEELAEIVRWRREHQPGGQNAGSVFVNPGSDAKSAGALIDASRLRGTRLRSAVVTEKHANFIQSDPDGLADDVLALMCVVQDAVQEEHGIRLRSEITLVGFDSELSSRFADDSDYVTEIERVPNAERAHAKLEGILARGDQT